MISWIFYFPKNVTQPCIYISYCAKWTQFKILEVSKQWKWKKYSYIFGCSSFWSGPLLHWLKSDLHWASPRSVLAHPMYSPTQLTEKNESIITLDNFLCGGYLWYGTHLENRYVFMATITNILNISKSDLHWASHRIDPFWHDTVDWKKPR